MKMLRICASKLDEEGAPRVVFNYVYEGAAFASISNGYVNVYELDTHTKRLALLKLDDYVDVSIYNYE